MIFYIIKYLFSFTFFITDKITVFLFIRSLNSNLRLIIISLKLYLILDIFINKINEKLRVHILDKPQHHH